DTMRPLIDAQGHHLSIALPAEPVPLVADATRLEQVLANLLHNAVKYTEPGGLIWLTVTNEDAGAETVFRVRESGVGMPAELLPHVFELVTQEHRSLDRSKGGLGIGLTLVRSLVELHGGSVSAYSAGAGCGSEFVVRLPRRLSAAPVMARAPAPVARMTADD